MINLEYSFIRESKRNTITLFLKVEESLLDKEVEILLNSEKKLEIKSIYNTYMTEELENILFQQLAYNDTLVVFCNAEGKFISEITLQPLLIESF